MLKQIRKIKQHPGWFLVNVGGLSIAFMVMLLALSYVHFERSYDTFHQKQKQIVRLTLNTNSGASSMIDARVWGGFVPSLLDEVPGLERAVRLSSYRKAIVRADNEIFYEGRVFAVDSSFFQTFDFKLLSGNPLKVLRAANEVVLTESTALKYFGSSDIIGKTIQITHQKHDTSFPYTISGILADFPENSHIKADILCTYDSEGQADQWCYSYFQLAENVTLTQVQDSIQAKFNVWTGSNGRKPNIVSLQPLSRIHLYSHKTMEMEPGGNIRNLYMLGSGALIILLIVLINFGNLNYVRYISDMKKYQIKRINGAHKGALYRELLSDKIILLLTTFILSALLLFLVRQQLAFFHLQSLTLIPLALIAISFVLLVLLFSILPVAGLLRSFSVFALSEKPRPQYPLFVSLQLLLSLVALITAFTLQKQMAYLNALHPKSDNARFIYMEQLPFNVVGQYETFKARLLQHPEFKNVTACMTEPGGMLTDNFYYQLDNVPQDEDAKQTINLLCVDTNFFKVFDTPVLAGTKDFGTSTSIALERQAMQQNYHSQQYPDEPTPEPLYHDKYILNRSALKHLGIASPEEAIGKKFDVDLMGNLWPEGEIIGVVDDIHFTDMHRKEKPMVIASRKMFLHNFVFELAPGMQNKALAVLQDEWTSLFPDVPFQYEFVSESYHKVYQNEYSQMRAISSFALIAIILSVIGLMVMVSFNVQRRTKEIGIRKVNGASIAKILNLLNQGIVRWLLVAFALAVPLAWLIARKWLENFAYKTPLSWWLFALAGLCMLCITLLTVSLQSWKAATRNPVEALRYE